MKGTKCRCGYATTSMRRVCPRCGKRMKPAEWSDEGEVLSFLKLDVAPVGMTEPFGLTLVAIGSKGPKVICWSPGVLGVGDEVIITEDDGKYFCNPKRRKKRT